MVFSFFRLFFIWTLNTLKQKNIYTLHRAIPNSDDIMNVEFLKEAVKIWNRVTVGEPSNSDLFDFEVQKKLLNIFAVGDCYYFIFNIKESKFDLMSEEVQAVLGYKPSEMDVSMLINKIHPDDQPWFLNIESKITEFVGGLTLDQIPNYKFRYDYRIQKKNGDYIRILQQTITLQYSEIGGIMKTFVVHTDISSLKKEGNPVVSFIGLNGEPSFIDIKIEKVFPIASTFLTSREQEILLLLINGQETKEIASALNISPDTVSTHRKNLLFKTKSRNTSEMITMAIRKGWV
jgi:DNA-binding CsgD family transcriptional regulator